MFLVVIIVSVLSMIIGALGFAWLNKRSDREKSRGRNIKLLTYVVLVFALYASMAFIPVAFYIIASVLIIIALREIFSAAHRTHKQPYAALAVSIPVFYFFAQFVKDTPMTLQLFTFFIVVHFDGFCQVAGEAFGKHKMLPAISPGKTWEGLLGGCLVAFGISLIVYHYTSFGRSITEVLQLTAMIIASAFAGDILASWYKRYCGIKDFSNLIPGHGGVLDRFDSFFMAAAVIQFLQSCYTQ